MSLVAFAAAKGAPGVTTTTLALGAAWPRPVLAAELDPAGGDLAVRFSLPGEPSVLTLAATARRHGPAGLVAAHTQRLPGGLPVLLAPADADQAAQAVRTQGLAAALARLPVDVLADCGRLDAGSPALELVRQADLTVLVARPEPARLQQLATRLPGVRARTGRLGLVLVGSGPYPAGEVAASLGVEVLGVLPFDRRAAAVLAGTPARGWVLRRTRLLRAAHALAVQLTARLPALPAARPAAVGERG